MGVRDCCSRHVGRRLQVGLIVGNGGSHGLFDSLCVVLDTSRHVRLDIGGGFDHGADLSHRDHIRLSLSGGLSLDLGHLVRHCGGLGQQLCLGLFQRQHVNVAKKFDENGEKVPGRRSWC